MEILKNFCWGNFERFLLILTFLCTAVSTTYAVFTARKALNLATIDLRPWIVVDKINTNLNEKDIEAKFEIKNIGKIPAFITYQFEIFLNGKITKEKNITSSYALMPGQTIHASGLTIRDEIYDKIINNEFSDKLIISIINPANKYTNPK